VSVPFTMLERCGAILYFGQHPHCARHIHHRSSIPFTDSRVVYVAEAKMTPCEVYKASTEIFVSWLCVTAADHGSATKSSRPIDAVKSRAGIRPSKPAARRKWIKGRDAANAANLTTDGRAIYLVSSQEILRQAEYIFKLSDTITLPRLVWQAYKRALAGWKLYAAKYAHTELHENTEIDGHIAFIGVLERLVAFLKIIVKVQRRSSAAAPECGPPEIALPNLFDSWALIDDDDMEDEEIS
jgi:hypothetical protein